MALARARMPPPQAAARRAPRSLPGEASALKAPLAPCRGPAGGAAAGATYVKVWIDKVQWAGESGAVLCLQQVYGASPCQELPGTVHLPLGAAEADDFQRALFGRLAPATGGDDALCDVRVHGCPEPFAELVMNAEGCAFPHDAPESGQFSAADFHDLGVKRHRYGIGEALGTAHRLDVPALVCTSYLLEATRACLSKAMLELAVQGGAGERPAHGPDDASLRALERQLQSVLSRGPEAGCGSTLRAASAFALYWALHQGRLGDSSPQPFTEFCARYLQLAGAADPQQRER
ncbi:unnamed protein product [Prorocentrum cordatum]|uniref:Uncharacterized protein n=1 Tax=Prorocentrum cordatum TaxID=2364126 RepID=A0ABN9Y0Z8_9DINO|nr:unnamed protein product [Polarella glacialis]